MEIFNKCQNINIKIDGNQCKANIDYKAFKQISLPSFISLDDKQISNQSIASIYINAKIIHSNIFTTPSSFETTNGENTMLSGYKLSIFGTISEVIMFEDINNSMKTHNTTIPFSTFIVLSKDTDISKEVCVNLCIEDIDVFYINSKDIFQSIYILMYVS